MKPAIEIRNLGKEYTLASARVLAASNPPLLDTAIYHCQQAAGKSVKGYPVYCGQEFERVHDIEVFIRLAMSCVEWSMPANPNVHQSNCAVGH